MHIQTHKTGKRSADIGSQSIMNVCFSFDPLVICHIAIENCLVEIVSFPSYKMLDLSSSFFLSLLEGNTITNQPPITSPYL